MIADQIERQALEARQRELETRAAGVEALIAAVAERDSYTGQHSRGVVVAAGQVARLLGLSEEEVSDVERVALLHDIGKLGVPDSILHKSGPLDAEEWEVMRRHPLVGERLIAKVPGLAHLAPALRAEHERWDGSGYPDGLAGEQIPISSRITFVCDAYDAMTSDRPYRAALPAATARAEIRSQAGSQFCPRSASALLALLGERTDA
jgi:HD-GYP domain-containing protein (c-di-GMP phosphodiesterase class II)